MAASLAADIKALVPSWPTLAPDLLPTFERYNEEQLITVTLPGSSQPVSPGGSDGVGRPGESSLLTDGCWQVLISAYNSLGEGRYYDSESSSSFAVDHTKQACMRAGRGWSRSRVAESHLQAEGRLTGLYR